MQVKQLMMVTFITGLISACTGTPPPVEHSVYLLALTDLQDARWNLEPRPGDVVSAYEELAIAEIDRAMTDAKKATRGNGKDLADHPHDDTRIGQRVRLHNAIELLRGAKSDIEQDKDNAENAELRGHITERIEAAIKATKRAFDTAQARAAETHKLQSQ